MIFSTRNGTMEAYLYFSIFKLIIAFTILLHNSAYADDDRYEACSKPFQCGTVSNLGYPFYDGDTRPEYCSYPGFKLNCSSVPPVLNISSSEEHYVLGVKTGLPVVTVARIDYWNGYCPENLHNTSINSTLFSYLDDVDEDVILYYECSNVSVPLTNSFHCSNMSSPFGYFVTEDLFESAYGRNKPRDTCNRSIVVPITNYESSALRVRDTFSLMSAFRYGFQLQWNAENNLCDECRKSGGACGFNTTTSRFTCYCPDQPYASKCPGMISILSSVP